MPAPSCNSGSHPDAEPDGELRRLRATNGMLRAVLDALPYRVFWKDRGLAYLGCNAAFAADAGVGVPSEIVGLTDLDLPWRDTEADQYRADDRAILDGRREDFLTIESQLPAAGETIWLETRKVPLADAAGETAAVLGTYCDVTEREVAARDAKLSRERLELALHNSFTGLWDWNVETGEAFFSDVWQEMLGYEPGEFPPRASAWEKLIHREDASTVRTQLERHFRGETDTYEVQFRTRHRAGRWVWIRACGRLIERTDEGRPLRMIGLHTDVTARKQTEAALRTAEERFRRSFEQSGIATCLAGLDGRIRRVNDAFAEMLGYDTADLEGRAYQEFTHPDDLALCDGEFTRFLSGACGTARWEKRYVAKDGGTVSAMLHLTLLRDPDGTPREVLAQAHDVTDWRADRVRLEKQEEALRHKQRMEAVGSLAGGIAHEFNNLLQAIGGYAAFALDGLAELPPEAGRIAEAITQDVRQIEEATARAAALTRQLLDYSRRGGRQRTTLDAREEVARLGTMIRPLIGERVELRVDADRDVGTVEADRTDLQQALMNLCLNARDAMESGGTLTLGLGRLVVEPDAPADDAAPLPPGAYVRFTVHDTGPGVPADIRGRIFDPFFTTKPVGRGTGMGLAMVYGVAEQHGGRVTVDTSPGDTTFTIDLPAASAAAPDDAPDAPAAAPAGPRILLAEDEPTVRAVAVRTLERAGFEVVAAERGDDAVRAFADRTAPFDLLLFDMVMPGLDGREAHERIAADSPGVPVLFCTGYDPRSDEAVKRCAGLPQVRKPIAPDDLVRAVREAIGEDAADSRTASSGSVPDAP